MRQLCLRESMDPLCSIAETLTREPLTTQVRANTAMKVMLRYFVARELGTAHTLCRAFDWSSNLLWTEEVRRDSGRLLASYH
jgi:hypothetical protein